MTAVFDGERTYASDSRTSAAEELALRLGWLCECPYHGEPYRRRPLGGAKGREAASLPDSGDDLALFATRMSEQYADECPICARESAIPE
jgi:hypothetical protein